MKTYRRICSWCEKVQGRAQFGSTGDTHGMCRSCAASFAATAGLPWGLRENLRAVITELRERLRSWWSWNVIAEDPNDLAIIAESRNSEPR